MPTHVKKCRKTLAKYKVKREDIAIPKYVLKNIPTEPVKKQEYKLVTPTQKEFDEIAVRFYSYNA